jgi:hypothetical protein
LRLTGGRQPDAATKHFDELSKQFAGAATRCDDAAQALIGNQAANAKDVMKGAQQAVAEVVDAIDNRIGTKLEGGGGLLGGLEKMVGLGPDHLTGDDQKDAVKQTYMIFGIDMRTATTALRLSQMSGPQKLDMDIATTFAPPSQLPHHPFNGLGNHSFHAASTGSDQARIDLGSPPTGGATAYGPVPSNLSVPAAQPSSQLTDPSQLANTCGSHLESTLLAAGAGVLGVGVVAAGAFAASRLAGGAFSTSRFGPIGGEPPTASSQLSAPANTTNNMLGNAGGQGGAGAATGSDAVGGNRYGRGPQLPRRKRPGLALRDPSHAAGHVKGYLPPPKPPEPKIDNSRLWGLAKWLAPEPEPDTDPSDTVLCPPQLEGWRP